MRRLSLHRRPAPLFFFIGGLFLAFLSFSAVPAFAAGHSGPVPHLIIFTQARCHDLTFHLIPASLTLIVGTQTDSAKVTPFVRRLPKGTTNIQIIAQDSVNFSQGGVGGKHCDFHHWRVRMGGINRIISGNPLVIDKLRTNVYVTPVYYNCTNPTVFPECKNVGSAGLETIAASAGVRFSADGKLTAETQSPDAQRLRIQLFDLQGRLLLDRATSGPRIEASLGEAAPTLASGLYLYVVTVWSADGRVISQRVAKIFLQR